jgi:PAS domain S-box-containing protein
MKIKLSVLERDEIGNPTLLIGTATDISADMTLKESLQGRVQLLELVLDSMSEGVIACDPNGDLLLVNRSARQILKTDSTLSSLSQVRAAYADYHDSESLALFWRHHPLVRTLAGEKVGDQDLSLFDRKRNLSMTLNHTADPLLDEEGQIVGAVDVFRDSTEKHRAFYELKRTEEQFRLLVEGTTDYAIFMLDQEGLVVSWNPGAERILGYGKSEVIGKHLSVFFIPEDHGKHEPEHKLRQASQEGRAEEDGWRVRKDGHRFWCTGITGALRNADGSLKGFVAILRDNTERRLVDQNNFFLANHDALTGLPNRARFLERLHEALINADRDRTRVAVLLVDLDRFKVINDTLGHQSGDQFLRMVSKRLMQCVRETDTVARLGGDEFVLIGLKCRQHWCEACCPRGE